MKEAVFIDTGAFYAKCEPKDNHHKESLALWSGLYEKSYRCFTTNVVLVELSNLLLKRARNRFETLQFIQAIYNSSSLEIIELTHKIEKEALDWLQRYQDQDFSLTDTVSFSVMKTKKIKKAFTFDHHFLVAGFEKFEG